MDSPLTFFVPFVICACSPFVTSAQSPTSDQELTGPPHLLARTVDEPTRQISDFVREVFQDRDGDYWFGTNGDGVCRYDGKSLTYLSVEQGFGGYAVRGILQDDGGAMWFATNGGVSRYEDGVFTNYTEADGLSANSVWSMMLDSSGTIWAGTHEGVCRFDSESFVPFALPRVQVENPESRFTPKVVFAMFEDPAGNLWFGTDGEGAHKYDGTSFTSYTTTDGLAGNLVRAIRGDRHGRIWIGTNGGGVSCYDGTTFRNFTQKDGLNNDRVYEILEDSAGNMWFSTLGAGACRYDGTSFTAFGEDHGLTINDLPCPCGSPRKYRDCHGPNGAHVQEFFEDTDGILWLGCSGGLFRLEGESFINVTRDGPWPVQSSVADPMAPFERLVTGEWRVTFTSGTSMFRIWNWGPGRHSLNVQTYGKGAVGQPWRALSVLYWHPGQKQIRLRGMSPYARGVSEGTIEFVGENVDAVFDLYQAGGVHREMGRRWAFDGHDTYVETLWDAGLPTMGEWHYARSMKVSATPTHTDDEGASEHLKIVEPLLGHTWEAKVDAGHTQTSFEYVPYADAISARMVALTDDGARTHLLDTYIYHHTGTGALRCLALSKSGGVYEGDVNALDGGAVQIDLEGHEGEQVVQLEVRYDFGEDGTVRTRVWAIEGSERALMLDVHHMKLDAKLD